MAGIRIEAVAGVKVRYVPLRDWLQGLVPTQDVRWNLSSPLRSDPNMVLAAQFNSFIHPSTALLTLTVLTLFVAPCAYSLLSRLERSGRRNEDRAPG